MASCDSRFKAQSWQKLLLMRQKPLGSLRDSSLLRFQITRFPFPIRSRACSFNKSQHASQRQAPLSPFLQCVSQLRAELQLETGSYMSVPCMIYSSAPKHGRGLHISEVLLAESTPKWPPKDKKGQPQKLLLVRPDGGWVLGRESLAPSPAIPEEPHAEP